MYSNLTGEGEWEENEVNGCISIDNSIIDKDTTKLLFSILLQGKIVDFYSLMNRIVSLMNRDDIIQIKQKEIENDLISVRDRTFYIELLF